MRGLCLLIGAAAMLSGCATVSAPVQQAAMSQLRVGLTACENQADATQVAIMVCKNNAMTAGYRSLRYPYMDLVYNLEGQSMQWAADVDAGRLSKPGFTARKQTALLKMQADEYQRNQADAQARRQAIAQIAQGLSNAAAQNAADLRAQAQAIQNNRPTDTNCVTSVYGTQAYTDCHTTH